MPTLRNPISASLLLAGSLLAAMAVPCAAQTFRVVATGTIYDIYDPAGRYDSSVVEGIPFTFSYKYSYDTAPNVAASYFTFYNRYGASSGATVSYGDYRFRPTKNSLSQVSILNDWLYDSGDGVIPQDFWSALTTESSITSSNHYAPRLFHGQSSIQFFDNTAAAFTSTDLTQLKTVNLPQFGNSGLFSSDVSWQDGSNPSDVIGQIQTLTITPVHDGDKDDDDGPASR